MSGRVWTREELILSLNLYFKLPKKKINPKTKEIIDLAKFLGRSPDSISMRLSNFISCDPSQKEKGLKGLDGGLNQCQPIWDEFVNNKKKLIKESNQITFKMNSLDSSNNNQTNKVKIIDQESIWSKIISLLNKKYIIHFSGSNPYLLKIKDKEYYIFLRNLTRAYPNRSFDVCRIQLHKSKKFSEIKNSNIPLVVLGYCEQYDTFASWSSEYIKPRLNGKRNISLYSRFSIQIPVENNKIREYELSNKEIVRIVNFTDIDLILSNDKIKEYYNNETSFSFNELKVHFNKKGFNENDLFLLIEDLLNDTSELKAIKTCIEYFENNKKEYNLNLIKNLITKFKSMI